MVRLEGESFFCVFCDVDLDRAVVESHEASGRTRRELEVY